MGWTWYVAHVGGKINPYRVLMGKPERDHLGDLNADGRIILKLR
jgi:hypothetical protein